MLDGRRKSVQPMAERLPDGNMQALQQFVNQSRWDPLPVRQRIAERLSKAISLEVWVIDDVSLFLPEEWADDEGRRRRAGIPDDVRRVSKTHLALGLLDRHLHHLRPTPAPQQNQTKNLTKHY